MTKGRRRRRRPDPEAAKEYLENFATTRFPTNATVWSGSGEVGETPSISPRPRLPDAVHRGVWPSPRSTLHRRSAASPHGPSNAVVASPRITALGSPACGPAHRRGASGNAAWITSSKVPTAASGADAHCSLSQFITASRGSSPPVFCGPGTTGLRRQWLLTHMPVRRFLHRPSPAE